LKVSGKCNSDRGTLSQTWIYKKMKKCPYCGRRIDYSSVFKNKKHGSYACERCKKESKVKIDNKMIILFVAVCLLVIVFMIGWVGAGLANNFWGVVIVGIILLAFNLATPSFISFVPLKKYINEATGKITEERIDVESFGDSDFVFNREAFDRIKKQKEMGLHSFDVESDNISSSSENMIPVIEDVKEGHISSSSGPLHKINRQPRYYEENQEEIFSNKGDAKVYTPRKNRKTEGSKYTANRKF